MRKNSVLLFQTMGRIRFDIRLFLWSICNSLRTHCFPCGISQILQIKDEKCFQEEKNNYKKKISCQGFVKLEIKWKGSLVFLKELWLLQDNEWKDVQKKDTNKRPSETRNRRKTRKKIINKTSYFLSNSLNKSLNQKWKLKISPKKRRRKRPETERRKAQKKRNY